MGGEVLRGSGIDPAQTFSGSPPGQLLARRVWISVGFASQKQAVLVFEDDAAEAATPPGGLLRCSSFSRWRGLASLGGFAAGMLGDEGLEDIENLLLLAAGELMPGVSPHFATFSGESKHDRNL